MILQRQFSDLDMQRFDVDGRCRPPGPNTPEAAASSCAFHVVIWFG